MNDQNIQYDDLEYTEEHTFVYQGIPFTGIAEERFPDHALRCVFPFHEGKEHGDVVEYFPTGGTMSRTPYVNGMVHGTHVEWFEGGQVKEVRRVEYGVLLQFQTFDKSGALIEEFVRPNDDPLMDSVRRWNDEAIQEH